MKSIWFFIITTVKGGVFFFFPIVFVYVAINKAAELITKVVDPLATRYGISGLAGKATLGILVALVIIFICFIGGLMMRIKQMKLINKKLDELLLRFVPHYQQAKPGKENIKEESENDL